MIKPTEAQQEFILRYYETLTEYRLALQACQWSIERLIDCGGLGIWLDDQLNDIQDFRMETSIELSTLWNLNNPVIVHNTYKRAAGRFLKGMVLNQP